MSLAGSVTEPRRPRRKRGWSIFKGKQSQPASGQGSAFLPVTCHSTSTYGWSATSVTRRVTSCGTALPAAARRVATVRSGPRLTLH